MRQLHKLRTGDLLCAVKSLGPPQHSVELTLATELVQAKAFMNSDTWVEVFEEAERNMQAVVSRELGGSKAQSQGLRRSAATNERNK